MAEVQLSGFPVTEEAMRPVSSERACFYCEQPIGGMHVDSCVLIKRTWKVRFNIELELDMPADWDRDMVDFQLNESSWCADNIDHEIARNIARLRSLGQCLCPSVSAEEFELIGAPRLDEGGVN